MIRLILLVVILSCSQVHAQVVERATASVSIQDPWGVLPALAERDFLVTRATYGAPLILSFRWDKPGISYLIHSYTHSGDLKIQGQTTRITLSQNQTLKATHCKEYNVSRSSVSKIQNYQRSCDDNFVVKTKFNYFRSFPDTKTIDLYRYKLKFLDDTQALVRTHGNGTDTYASIDKGYSFAKRFYEKLVTTGKLLPSVPDKRITFLLRSADLVTSSNPIPTFNSTPKSQPVQQQIKIPVGVETNSGATLNSLEPRVALVIGNSRYQNFLTNPVNDAKLVANALMSTGFDVEIVLDASQEEMNKAVARLGDRMRKSGKTTTGLFYFAGHGVQSQGSNYLLPIKSPIVKEADLVVFSMSADAVLRQMESAGAGTNLLILDACRDMPLMRRFRNNLRGLAQMKAPNGTFIAYSTAPGSVAEDGIEQNSTFAKSFSSEILTKNQPIESTFRKVRKDVLNATNGQQTPWDASSLLETFVFSP